MVAAMLRWQVAALSLCLSSPHHVAKLALDASRTQKPLTISTRLITTGGPDRSAVYPLHPALLAPVP